MQDKADAGRAAPPQRAPHSDDGQARHASLTPSQSLDEQIEARQSRNRHRDARRRGSRSSPLAHLTSPEACEIAVNDTCSSRRCDTKSYGLRLIEAQTPGASARHASKRSATRRSRRWRRLLPAKRPRSRTSNDSCATSSDAWTALEDAARASSETGLRVLWSDLQPPQERPVHQSRRSFRTRSSAARKQDDDQAAPFVKRSTNTSRLSRRSP